MSELPVAEETGKEYHDQESLLLVTSTSFRDIWEEKCKSKMRCGLKMNTKESTVFTSYIKTCFLHKDNVDCPKSLTRESALSSAVIFVPVWRRMLSKNMLIQTHTNHAINTGIHWKKSIVFTLKCQSCDPWVPNWFATLTDHICIPSSGRNLEDTIPAREQEWDVWYFCDGIWFFYFPTRKRACQAKALRTKLQHNFQGFEENN